MELMSGGDLYTLLERKGKVNESKARSFVQQIVAGLAHCHCLNICHRDIKLENLLMDSDNNVKICDFGFARVCKDGEFCKTMCGTPAYCAPEVLGNEIYYGAAADIWSLGVVLYCLLVGKLPFEEVNTAALYTKAMKRCYNEPRHVSTAVKQLLRRMLDPNPVTRITIDEIQSTAWFKRKLPAYIQQHLVIKEDVSLALIEKCRTLKYFTPRAESPDLLSQLLAKQGSFYLCYELLKIEQDQAVITEARAAAKAGERYYSFDAQPQRILGISRASTPLDWTYGLDVTREVLAKLKPIMKSLGSTLLRFTKNQISVEAALHKFVTALYISETGLVVDFKYTEGSVMGFFDHAASVIVRRDTTLA